MARFLSVLALMAGFGAQVAQAQAAPDTLLPDLTPQEVEIMGELDIAFPLLERQPLTGFNPPPQIYEVPRERRPFIGEYKQPATSLPVSPLSRPEPLVSGRVLDRPLQGGRLVLGAGRYFARRAALDTSVPISDGVGAYLTGAYRGSSLFAPDALNEENVPHDDAQGRIGVQAARGLMVAGLEAGGMFSRYRIYSDAVPAGLEDALPYRTGNGFGGRAFVRRGQAASTPFELSVSYGGTRFEIEPEEGETVNPLERRAERVLDLNGSAGIDFGAGDVALVGRYTAGGLDSDALLGDDHTTFKAGGQVAFEVEPHIRLEAGARIIGFSVSQANEPGLSEARSSNSFVAPFGRLDIRLGEKLAVYGKNEPMARPNRLADVFRANPYVVSEPILKPNVATLNAEAGIITTLGRARLSGFGGVQRFQERLVFRRQNPNALLFSASYEKAEVAFAGVDASVALPGQLSVGARFEVRDGNLRDPEADLPHFASVDATGRLSWQFADTKGLADVSVHVVGSRPDEFGNTLDGYGLINTTISYYITERAGIFVQASQIALGEFVEWPGVEPESNGFLAGFQVRW